MIPTKDRDILQIINMCECGLGIGLANKMLENDYEYIGNSLFVPVNKRTKLKGLDHIGTRQFGDRPIWGLVRS